MTNPHGGAACRMTAAPGYSKSSGGELLVSGIWSHATEWTFEYVETDIVPPPEPMPKFTEYKPVGMIAQAPACREDYKGRNAAGGRKCPPGYIGAGLRAPQQERWTKGLENLNDISVLFGIRDNAVLLSPNKNHNTP